MFLVSIVLGLSMKLVGSSHNDCMYFKYDHNTNYQKIQKRFLEAVDSLDHNSILVSSQSKNIVLLSAVLVQMSVTTLLYLKYCLTLHSGCCGWWEAGLPSLLFPFPMSLGPNVLFHCVAVDIKLLFTMFKEGAEICFLGLTDGCHM